MRRWLRLRAVRWVGGIVLFGALAGVAVGAVLYVWNDRRTADVRGSTSEDFVLTEEPGLGAVDPPPPAEPPPPAPAPAPAPVTESLPETVPAPTETAPVEPAPVAPETPPDPPVEPAPVVDEPALDWPIWGLDPARTRVVPDAVALRPPYRKLWAYRAGSLVEFPPVVEDGVLYVGTNLGRVVALDGETGSVLWERDTKRCIAASPAVARGVVYVSLMDPSPCKEHDQQAPGYLVALDAATGEERWRFEAGVIESSPLLVDGTLYVGSWDRRIWAVDAATGTSRWSFETGDRVKGSVSFRNGVVFAGSYDGKIYALDARTGELRWRASGRAGIGSGTRIYSTPALAYGRLFVGDVNGQVYAFSAASGELAWARGTGGYVYSSPAVYDRTVFVGSYDGKVHAFDAATGDTRWTFDAAGPISGSPTVMAGLVYVSTFDERTFALDARSGKVVWDFADGQYTPIVTDGERLYLAGHVRIFGFAEGEPADPDNRSRR